MKLIISMQDGRVNMISVNRIEQIYFNSDSISIIDAFEETAEVIYYSDIRSIVIS